VGEPLVARRLLPAPRQSDLHPARFDTIFNDLKQQALQWLEKLNRETKVTVNRPSLRRARKPAKK
jgi:hypothetical protein